MIYRPYLVIGTLVLFHYVRAGWVVSSEGDTGSGIQAVDTDGGFSVTDSGGQWALVGELPTPHTPILHSQNTKRVRGNTSFAYNPPMIFSPSRMISCMLPFAEY